jgi:ATP-dependent Clp protease adaptor protein ClpS
VFADDFANIRLKFSNRTPHTSLPHLFLLNTMAVRHKEDVASATQIIPAPPPPLFKVLLLNDDYTPMEFVVMVLEKFFHLDREQATQVMLEVHNKGSGVAGIFPHGVAETKVYQVMSYARNHQHPLQCVMEEDR